MCRESQTYRYRVNAADQIVWVDSLWLAFAQENGASELTEQSVIGHTLWDFIAGDVTRQLFANMHAEARQRQKAVVLPFRCDSPSLKRHMQLTITAENAGYLLYKSVLLQVEPQDDVGEIYEQRGPSDCFLTMCSCCKRVLVESLGWLGLDDVSARLRILDQQQVPSLRYAVCSDCTYFLSN